MNGGHSRESMSKLHTCANHAYIYNGMYNLNLQGLLLVLEVRATHDRLGV